MTDDTNKPPAGVPMSKPAAGRPDPAPSATRPRTVALAIGALGIAALFTIITALGWSSQKTWVKQEVHKANASAVSSAVSSATASAAKKSQDVARASASASSSAIKKHPVAASDVQDQANKQVRSILTSTLFGVLVLGFLGYGAYRGRHWTRWAVTGFFVVASLTGIGVGLLSFAGALAGSGTPAAVRVPTLIASLSMMVAVVLVNLRPSVAYFALSRPVATPGAPPRRGLFGPRPPRPGQPQRAAGTRATGTGGKDAGATGPRAAGTPAQGGSTNAAAKDTDRQRAKKRASSDSAARGAELARSRAKASKSRRTER